MAARNVNRLFLEQWKSIFIEFLLQICNFSSDVWKMTLNPCRTKLWHASIFGPRPLATETQHASEKRTWAWETLLGERTRAQSPAGIECPKGRYATPSITGPKVLLTHCGNELPVRFLTVPTNTFRAWLLRIKAAGAGRAQQSLPSVFRNPD